MMPVSGPALPCRRVNAGCFLGHPTAIGKDETKVSGRCAERMGHLGNAVEGIIVSGAAEEGQTACQGERTWIGFPVHAHGGSG